MVGIAGPARRSPKARGYRWAPEAVLRRRFHLHLAPLDRGLEAPVVAFGLIGVGLGEVGHGLVEAVALAEIRAAMAMRSTGTGVAAGQRPAAKGGEDLQTRRLQDLVSIEPLCRAAGASRTGGRSGAGHPAQEDVARRLHEALAGHHAVAGVDEAARPAYGSSTEGPASLTCKKRGSSSSRPSIRAIRATVPTLPTPTTFRATSTAA